MPNENRWYHTKLSTVPWCRMLPRYTPAWEIMLMSLLFCMKHCHCFQSFSIGRLAHLGCSSVSHLCLWCSLLEQACQTLHAEGFLVICIFCTMPILPLSFLDQTEDPFWCFLSIGRGLFIIPLSISGVSTAQFPAQTMPNALTREQLDGK